MKESGIGEELELAKKRCGVVIDRTPRLPLIDSCRSTLLRLAHSELNFLSRCPTRSSTRLSSNIGHLEAIVHILQQPCLTGVSRVCKPIPVSSTDWNGLKTNSCSKGVHVDIVCTLNRQPVWIIVSDRNPRYIPWDRCQKSKGLRLRVEEVLAAARSSMTLKPYSIILFFSNGVGNFVREKLREEFGASEIELEFSVFDFDFSEDLDGEWINVVARSYQDACVLEIKVDDIGDIISSPGCELKGSSVAAVAPRLSEELAERSAGDPFCSLISRMKYCPFEVKNLEYSEMKELLGEVDLINFDTTALIALVSGISNGCTEKLLGTPESELRQRFKGNFEFVIGQVMSEIENPIHEELGGVISGRRGIICESVHSEFMDLVLMCGGPNEKFRANQLLKCLMLVPDGPSQRVMGLPTTRKLALKNKVVFGTGDYWLAPTLTANMAFVRAISQTGMSLFTIEHRPRALTGD
ncbi:uncharacterized protein LOC121241871 isoform X2 [Juglans microcarpa x Juglans regia]|uniref:uncharacterized protein LOC121241871 isoform X2 n=1 Tax=Juglans microcarpa x Juglans regia TaxID=2249226 RepID=UPI001B7E3AF5|nr:uncharacterized protein LOC121241871 isoform X2 [Juglans microcarpa x Juglans regia]